jgi:hypothetical protein
MPTLIIIKINKKIKERKRKKESACFLWGEPGGVRGVWVAWTKPVISDKERNI